MVLDALDTIGDGRFDIDIELDDTVTVNARGRIETSGYRDDNWFCGTGSWIETGRGASCVLSASVWDASGSRRETCAVPAGFEDMCNRYLCEAS